MKDELRKILDEEEARIRADERAKTWQLAIEHVARWRAEFCADATSDTAHAATNIEGYLRSRRTAVTSAGALDPIAEARAAAFEDAAKMARDASDEHEARRERARSSQSRALREAEAFACAELASEFDTKAAAIRGAVAAAIRANGR